MPIDPVKLKSLRQRAGLTQQALADAAGLARQATIANLERGAVSNPRLSTIEALATALGVTVRRLLS